LQRYEKSRSEQDWLICKDPFLILFNNRGLETYKLTVALLLKT